MAGEDPDDYPSPSETPWYNRTPNVIGASVAGLALIGLLIAAVTFVARQLNEPEQAPLNYVEPSFSATAGQSSTPTTTATITSTSPPVTTDIDGPSSTTTSPSSDTSSTDTPSTTHTAWTRPYTPPSGEDSEPSTTRRGPRTNVTRTLYPQP
jgi:cytoskeletal protein RodZ